MAEQVDGAVLPDVKILGPLETPAGIVKPTGAKVDGPCADFWYLRDGKIEMFNCYIMLSTMRAQMGVPEGG